MSPVRRKEREPKWMRKARESLLPDLAGANSGGGERISMLAPEKSKAGF
jgi:hypothetical protein